MTEKYKLVVIVTCQGQPFYYFYNCLFKALTRFAYMYLTRTKYGTMNFQIKNAFMVNKNNIRKSVVRKGDWSEK